MIGRCCNAIAGEDVNIEMISQGAVKGSISLVVRQVEGQRAARALHRELFENKGKSSAETKVSKSACPFEDRNGSYKID